MLEGHLRFSRSPTLDLQVAELEICATFKNRSIQNVRNRLFSCSGVALLIRFLVFHLIKISFVIPEACAIIFSTASLINKFMKKRNKKKKNMVYVAAHAPNFFFTYIDVLRNTRFVSPHLLLPRRSQIFQHSILFSILIFYFAI